MQPCCETLTLRHAWLSLRDKRVAAGRINQVQLLRVLAKRERREREREREGRRREEERGRGAADPGRKGRKKRHVQKHLPGLYRYRMSGRCPVAKRKQGGEREPRPATRRGGGRGEEEEERERAKKNTGAQKKTTPEKNPAAFSD